MNNFLNDCLKQLIATIGFITILILGIRLLRVLSQTELICFLILAMIFCASLFFNKFNK